MPRQCWNRSTTNLVLTLCLALAAPLLAQPARYRQLRGVVDQNTGFAHMTRGVNMFTLYALRSCVGPRDLPVLGDLLRDKDRITRMAAASVLADMGAEGIQVVRSRLAEVQDPGEKLMLRDSLDSVAKADYRPILQYPMSAAERARIRACQ